MFSCSEAIILCDHVTSCFLSFENRLCSPSFSWTQPIMLVTVLHLSFLLHAGQCCVLTEWTSVFPSYSCINPPCPAGLCIVVLQSRDEISHPGNSLTLECSLGRGFSMGSYTMYWYRQKHSGAQIEFLIKEYEETAGHFQSSIRTSDNYFSLQISELFVNDSSVYYCAASHSDTHRPGCHTNIKTDGRKEGAVASLILCLTENTLFPYSS